MNGLAIKKDSDENKIPEKYLLKKVTANNNFSLFLTEHSAIDRAIEIIFIFLQGMAVPNSYLNFEDNNYFFDFNFWNKVPYSEIALSSKDASLNYLDSICLFIAKHNMKIIITTIPTRTQVYCRNIEGKDFSFIDPLEYLRSSVNSKFKNGNNYTDIYLAGDGHFNDLGHNLFGNYLSQKLLFLKE